MSSLQDLLQRPSLEEDLERFCTDKNLHLLLLVNLARVGNETPQRQLGVYTPGYKTLKDNLVRTLQEADSPSLELSEMDGAPPSVMAFDQGNVAASRKKIMPLAQQFLEVTEQDPEHVKELLESNSNTVDLLGGDLLSGMESPSTNQNNANDDDPFGLGSLSSQVPTESSVPGQNADNNDPFGLGLVDTSTHSSSNNNNAVQESSNSGLLDLDPFGGITSDNSKDTGPGPPNLLDLDPFGGLEGSSGTDISSSEANLLPDLSDLSTTDSTLQPPSLLDLNPFGGMVDTTSGGSPNNPFEITPVTSDLSEPMATSPSSPSSNPVGDTTEDLLGLDPFGAPQSTTPGGISLMNPFDITNANDQISNTNEGNHNDNDLLGLNGFGGSSVTAQNDKNEGNVQNIDDIFGLGDIQSSPSDSDRNQNEILDAGNLNILTAESTSNKNSIDLLNLDKPNDNDEKSNSDGPLLAVDNLLGVDDFVNQPTGEVHSGKSQEESADLLGLSMSANGNMEDNSQESQQDVSLQEQSVDALGNDRETNEEGVEKDNIFTNGDSIIAVPKDIKDTPITPCNSMADMADKSFSSFNSKELDSKALSDKVEELHRKSISEADGEATVIVVNGDLSENPSFPREDSFSPSGGLESSETISDDVSDSSSGESYTVNDLNRGPDEFPITQIQEVEEDGPSNASEGQEEVPEDVKAEVEEYVSDVVQMSSFLYKQEVTSTEDKQELDEASSTEDVAMIPVDSEDVEQKTGEDVSKEVNIKSEEEQQEEVDEVPSNDADVTMAATESEVTQVKVDEEVCDYVDTVVQKALFSYKQEVNEMETEKVTSEEEQEQETMENEVVVVESGEGEVKEEEEISSVNESSLVDTNDANADGADTQGACADGTDVEGASTEGANVEGASTESADVEGASTEGANVEGASTESANVDGASTEDTSTEDANVEGASTESADVEGASTEGASTESADVEGASTEGSNVEGASTESANVDGASTEDANVEGASTESADVEGASTEGASTESADVEGASTEGSNVEGASTEGSNVEGASTEGSNVEGASTEGSNVEGAFTEDSNVEGASVESPHAEGANSDVIIEDELTDERQPDVIDVTVNTSDSQDLDKGMVEEVTDYVDTVLQMASFTYKQEVSEVAQSEHEQATEEEINAKEAVDIDPSEECKSEGVNNSEQLDENNTLVDLEQNVSKETGNLMDIVEPSQSVEESCEVNDAEEMQAAGSELKNGGVTIATVLDEKEQNVCESEQSVDETVVDSTNEQTKEDVHITDDYAQGEDTEVKSDEISQDFDTVLSEEQPNSTSQIDTAKENQDDTTKEIRDEKDDSAKEDIDVDIEEVKSFVDSVVRVACFTHQEEIQRHQLEEEDTSPQLVEEGVLESEKQPESYASPESVGNTDIVAVTVTSPSPTETSPSEALISDSSTARSIVEEPVLSSEVMEVTEAVIVPTEGAMAESAISSSENVVAEAVVSPTEGSITESAISNSENGAPVDSAVDKSDADEKNASDIEESIQKMDASFDETLPSPTHDSTPTRPGTLQLLESSESPSRGGKTKIRPIYSKPKNQAGTPGSILSEDGSLNSVTTLDAVSMFPITPSPGSLSDDDDDLNSDRADRKQDSTVDTHSTPKRLVSVDSAMAEDIHGDWSGEAEILEKAAARQREVSNTFIFVF